MKTSTLAAKGAELAELLLANAEVPGPDDAPAAKGAGGSLPEFSNWEWVEAPNGKPRKKGLPLSDICHELEQLTSGWPRRVDRTLFARGPGHHPRYLDNPAQLFAWLDAQAF